MAKPAASPTQPVSFMSDEGKKQLIQNSSQVNPVSQKAGNSDSICGGAAVVNGLILSSKTPEDAKANSQALRAAAGKVTGISKEQDAALKRMETGTMSPQDVQHLQQLGYQLAKSNDVEGSDPLVNSGEMGFAVAQLKANGGFPGAQSVDFSNARLPGEGNHWTVAVDGVHADSMTGAGGKSGTVMSPAPDHTKMRANNPSWRGGVSLSNFNSPPTVDVNYRKTEGGRDVPGLMHTVRISDPAQYKMTAADDTAHRDALLRKINESKTNEVRLGD